MELARLLYRRGISDGYGAFLDREPVNRPRLPSPAHLAPDQTGGAELELADRTKRTHEVHA